MIKQFSKMTDEIKEEYDIFKNPSSTPWMIEQSGEKMFLAIFNAKNEPDLNQLRYKSFLRISNKPKVDLATLPPTRGSAKQHSFRVYLQVNSFECICLTVYKCYTNII